MFLKYRQKKLEKYVQQYLSSHADIKLVAVAGSAEKATTKTMIAELLSGKHRVRMDDAIDPSRLQTALDILGVSQPEGKGLFAWRAIYTAARERIKQPSDIDVIVQEFDANQAGDLVYFTSYVRPNIAVVTSVNEQNAEGFGGSVEAVAKEELALANSSEFALINHDQIDGRFADLMTNANFATYGSTDGAEYTLEAESVSAAGYKIRAAGPGFSNTKVQELNFLGESNLRSASAAVAVGSKLGLTEMELALYLENLHALPGQMNTLRAANESWIIDNTDNAAVVSTMADLQLLYDIDSPQRIALFGDLQTDRQPVEELYSKLGSSCDVGMLSWVVTVGEQAEKYLAPKAKARGCQVKSFKNPIEAGAFVHSVIQKDGVVLAAGAKDAYIEEALKIFLHEIHEDHELVRQSEKWTTIKNEHFSSVQPEA